MLSSKLRGAGLRLSSESREPGLTTTRVQRPHAHNTLTATWHAHTPTHTATAQQLLRLGSWCRGLGTRSSVTQQLRQQCMERVECRWNVCGKSSKLTHRRLFKPLRRPTPRLQLTVYSEARLCFEQLQPRNPCYASTGPCSCTAKSS